MKKAGGRDFFILLILLILGGLFGRMQSTARQNGATDLPSSIIKSSVSPIASVTTSVANWSSDFLGGIFNAAELSRKARDGKQFQLVASQYMETVNRLNKEIDYLRSLNNLPPVGGREKVFATVTGYFPLENRITISSGANRGLRAGLPVLTAEGLVGIIQTVDRSSSQVSLLTDPNRKVGALVINRDPPPLGIIRGENQALLILTLDSTSPVENGDVIATSGFSDRIPRAIPIGKVNQVYSDPTTGSKRVEVFPNVALGNVREVVILK